MLRNINLRICAAAALALISPILLPNHTGVVAQDNTKSAGKGKRNGGGGGGGGALNRR